MRLGWQAALAALVLIAGGARAQSYYVLSDPNAIGRCLCGQRFVETLHGEVEAAQRDYDEAHRRLEALDRRVAEERANVDTDDPDAVDAFRRLVREDEGENATFFNSTLPHTQSVYDRYNRRLSRYTAECGGKSFDPVMLARVQATLACGVDQDE